MMSYQSAKRQYESEKFEVTSEPVLKCRDCYTTTTREEASGYGLRCTQCYQSWCRQAPAYIPKKDYGTDPKGWARRIIDRHNDGQGVSSIALKFANEALGNRHGL
jgi:hypothetical protein